MRGPRGCYGAGLAGTRTAGHGRYVYQAPGRVRIPRRIRAQPRLPERYTRAIGEEDGGVRATWLPTTTARGRPTTSSARTVSKSSRHDGRSEEHTSELQ